MWPLKYSIVKKIESGVHAVITNVGTRAPDRVCEGNCGSRVWHGMAIMDVSWSGKPYTLCHNACQNGWLDWLQLQSAWCIPPWMDIRYLVLCMRYIVWVSLFVWWNGTNTGGKHTAPPANTTLRRVSARLSSFHMINTLYMCVCVWVHASSFGAPFTHRSPLWRTIRR